MNGQHDGHNGSQDGGKIGSIAWVDLTVPDAAAVRDFYQQVVGWESQPVDMGGYDDFNMLEPGSEKPAAGVCYRRGANADLPPQWLVYIVVADMERSLASCERLGGQVIANHWEQDRGGFCVIRDPAGAIAALYEPPPSE